MASRRPGPFTGRRPANCGPVVVNLFAAMCFLVHLAGPVTSASLRTANGGLGAMVLARRWLSPGRALLANRQAKVPSTPAKSPLGTGTRLLPKGTTADLALEA